MTSADAPLILQEKKNESFAKSPAIEVWKINGMAGGGGAEALEDATAMLGGRLSLLLAPSSLSRVGWGHAVETFLVCEERPCAFGVEPTIAAQRTRAFIPVSGQISAFETSQLTLLQGLGRGGKCSMLLSEGTCRKLWPSENLY